MAARFAAFAARVVLFAGLCLAGRLGAVEDALRDALEVEAADVDRDGHGDLVVLHGGPAPHLRILFGDTSGFAPGRSETLPLGTPARAPARGDLSVADLNHDGRPDVVVTLDTLEPFVLWNRYWTGRGNLSQWPRTPLGATTAAASAVADFDRDGLLDLALVGGDVKVHWGHATRTFVTHGPTPLPRPGQPVTRKSAAVTPAAPAFRPPLVRDAEPIVLHREPGRYSAFPTLRHVHGQPESLHVHFGARETSSHVEARQMPHNRVSTDGGRTWRPSEAQPADPAWRSRGSRLVHPTTHGWRPVAAERRAELEAQGLEVRNAPDGRVTYLVGCFVRISEDDGATWTERPIAVPPQALVSGYHDECTTLRLDERTILRGIYGKPVARVRYYESWLLRSEDDGETWTFHTIAADLARDDRGFSETALAEAANGDVVAMMRIEPPMGTHLWMARSSDRGKTWSPPVETALRGFPAHLLRLRDGRLLCTYGYREDPIGIRAAISRDHGRTWREEDIVTLRDDGSGAPGDNGYPITAELADGSLVTVYYLTRDGITGVEATRWKDPW